MPALKLTPLRHFSAVAELKSIGVASRVLHISQPALTRSIQRLERETEGPLFERGSKGVELTARGEALLPYVKAMLAEADRAKEQLREMKGRRRMQIKLGASTNLAQYVCPDIIADFVREYPDSNILTATGTGEQLLSMLSSSELDLAITLTWGTTLQMALAKNPALAHEPLGEMTARVFAPAGHRLASTDTATLEELATERWAVPHGLSLSYIFQDVFVSRDLPAPPQVINSSNLPHMLTLAKRLQLLLIMPPHIVNDAVRAGEFIPLSCEPLELHYQVEMISRRRGTQATGLTHFRELARRHFAQAGLH